MLPVEERVQAFVRDDIVASDQGCKLLVVLWIGEVHEHTRLLVG